MRDVAVRITGYQPYCYVKQKAHIDATLRLIGCELEDLTVKLLRQGLLVQTKHVNAQQLQELPVEFEVTEPDGRAVRIRGAGAAAGQRGGHGQQQRDHLSQRH